MWKAKVKNKKSGLSVACMGTTRVACARIPNFLWPARKPERESRICFVGGSRTDRSPSATPSPPGSTRPNPRQKRGLFFGSAESEVPAKAD
jgi:hypothetical protein